MPMYFKQSHFSMPYFREVKTHIHHTEARIITVDNIF